MPQPRPEAGPASGPASVASGPPDELQLPDSVRLWLLRHGETAWSASGRHTSRTDLPLTETGERQAAALATSLSGLQPSLVWSSPRRRALDTARLAGLVVDEVTEDLAEWNYGDYEGRTSTEIRRERPGWTIWADGTPGESVDEVAARADRLLARLAPALQAGPVVLVGHGHFSRVLTARWIGLPARAGAHLLLDAAGGSLLGAQYGAPAIRYWNVPNAADCDRG